MEKTNVMRVLAQKKIPYKEYYYGDTGAISGVEVADALGEDPERAFKTLVTVGKTKQNYVFMIPVAEGEEHRHDPPEGTSASHGVRSRGLFSHRDEEAVQDCDRRFR